MLPLIIFTFLVFLLISYIINVKYANNIKFQIYVQIIIAIGTIYIACGIIYQLLSYNQTTLQNNVEL
jgi:hypothetical protein